MTKSRGFWFSQVEHGLNSEFTFRIVLNVIERGFTVSNDRIGLASSRPRGPDRNDSPCPLVADLNHPQGGVITRGGTGSWTGLGFPGAVPEPNRGWERTRGGSRSVGGAGASFEPTGRRSPRLPWVAEAERDPRGRGGHGAGVVPGVVGETRPFRPLLASE